MVGRIHEQILIVTCTRSESDVLRLPQTHTVSAWLGPWSSRKANLPGHEPTDAVDVMFRQAYDD